MDVFLSDWLNLLIRWAHLIVGIGWIGTSLMWIRPRRSARPSWFS